jgi:hypothetical protein
VVAGRGPSKKELLMVHTYSPSTQETEVKIFQVLNQPELHSLTLPQKYKDSYSEVREIAIK